MLEGRRGRAGCCMTAMAVAVAWPTLHYYDYLQYHLCNPLLCIWKALFGTLFDAVRGWVRTYWLLPILWCGVFSDDLFNYVLGNFQENFPTLMMSGGWWQILWYYVCEQVAVVAVVMMEASPSDIVCGSEALTFIHKATWAFSIRQEAPATTIITPLFPELLFPSPVCNLLCPLQPGNLLCVYGNVVSVNLVQPKFHVSYVMMMMLLFSIWRQACIIPFRQMNLYWWRDDVEMMTDYNLGRQRLWPTSIGGIIVWSDLIDNAERAYWWWAWWWEALSSSLYCVTSS